MALVPDEPMDVTVQLARNQFFNKKAIDKEPDLDCDDEDHDDDDELDAIETSLVGKETDTPRIHESYDELFSNQHYLEVIMCYHCLDNFVTIV